MDRRFGGVTWLPSQIAAINPLLILILVPVFHGGELLVPAPLSRLGAAIGVPPRQRLRFPGVYDALGRSGVRVTPLRRISVGFFLCGCAFLIPLQVERWIAAGGNHSHAGAAPCAAAEGEGGASGAGGADGCAPGPNTVHGPSIAWHLLSYVVLTISEVLVSVTGLEFSYTQAPQRMKSMVMACYLGATAAGNLLTMLINAAIQNDDGSSRWTDVEYYEFFCLLMFVTAVAFVLYAASFKERRYVQGVPAEDGTGQRGTRSPPESPGEVTVQCVDRSVEVVDR